SIAALAPSIARDGETRGNPSGIGLTSVIANLLLPGDGIFVTAMSARGGGREQGDEDPAGQRFEENRAPPGRRPGQRSLGPASGRAGLNATGADAHPLDVDREMSPAR